MIWLNETITRNLSEISVILFNTSFLMWIWKITQKLSSPTLVSSTIPHMAILVTIYGNVVNYLMRYWSWRIEFRVSLHIHTGKLFSIENNKYLEQLSSYVLSPLVKLRFHGSAKNCSHPIKFFRIFVTTQWRGVSHVKFKIFVV